MDDRESSPRELFADTAANRQKRFRDLAVARNLLTAAEAGDIQVFPGTTIDMPFIVALGEGIEKNKKDQLKRLIQEQALLQDQAHEQQRSIRQIAIRARLLTPEQAARFVFVVAGYPGQGTFVALSPEMDPTLFEKVSNLFVQYGIMPRQMIH